jgi:hypothetical protein
VTVLLGQRSTATHLQVTAPASVTAGSSFTVTVSALTAGGQVDDQYTGTVHFTSSDGSAVLPANYTFTKADLGVNTFTVTLNSTGTQTITAADKSHKTIKGTATVTVNPAAAPAPAGERSGRVAIGSAADAAERSAVLAALLADVRWTSPGLGQHPVSLPTTPAADLSPRPSSAGLPSGLAARVDDVLVLPAVSGPEATRLRQADVDAWFAFAPHLET